MFGLTSSLLHGSPDPREAFRYYRWTFLKDHEMDTHFAIQKIRMFDGDILVSPINMTSDTTPSPYVVTCSKIYSTSHPAWRCFTDYDDYGIFLSNRVDLPVWVQIDLGSEKVCTSYNLSVSSYGGGPKTWKLEASDTGNFSGEQVLIDYRQDQDPFKMCFTYYFKTIFGSYRVPEIDPEGYRYYKISLTDTLPQSYVSMVRWNFIDDNEELFIPWDTLISNDSPNPYEFISHTPYHGSWPPYRVNTYKVTTGLLFTNPGGDFTCEMVLDIGSKKNPKAYMLTQCNTSSYGYFSGWFIEASNTGHFTGEQVLIDERSDGPIPGDPIGNVYPCATIGKTLPTMDVSGSYRYYRIVVTEANLISNYWGISYLEFRNGGTRFSPTGVFDYSTVKISVSEVWPVYQALQWVDNGFLTTNFIDTELVLDLGEGNENSLTSYTIGRHPSYGSPNSWRIEASNTGNFMGEQYVYDIQTDITTLINSGTEFII